MKWMSRLVKTAGAPVLEPTGAGRHQVHRFQKLWDEFRVLSASEKTRDDKFGELLRIFCNIVTSDACSPEAVTPFVDPGPFSSTVASYLVKDLQRLSENGKDGRLSMSDVLTFFSKTRDNGRPGKGARMLMALNALVSSNVDVGPLVAAGLLSALIFVLHSFLSHESSPVESPEGAADLGSKDGGSRESTPSTSPRTHDEDLGSVASEQLAKTGSLPQQKSSAETTAAAGKGKGSRRSAGQPDGRLLVEGSIVHVMKALARHPLAGQSLIEDESLQLLFEMVSMDLGTTGEDEVSFRSPREGIVQETSGGDHEHGHDGKRLHNAQLQRHARQILELVLTSDMGTDAVDYIERRNLMGLLLNAVSNFDPEKSDRSHIIGVVSLMVTSIRLSSRQDVGEDVVLREAFRSLQGYRLLMQLAITLSMPRSGSSRSGSIAGEPPADFAEEYGDVIDSPDSSPARALAFQGGPAASARAAVEPSITRLLDLLVELAGIGRDEEDREAAEGRGGEMVGCWILTEGAGLGSAAVSGAKNKREAVSVIRDVEAVQILRNVFLKSTNLGVQLLVLDRLLSLFANHPGNYQIVQELGLLPLLIKEMPRLALVLQEQLLKVLEYVITVGDFIPEQELLSLCCLLQAQPEEIIGEEAAGGSLGHTILSFFYKLMSFDQKFKEILRNVGLLDVLVDHLKNCHTPPHVSRNESVCDSQTASQEVSPATEALSTVEDCAAEPDRTGEARGVVLASDDEKGSAAAEVQLRGSITGSNRDKIVSLYDKGGDNLTSKAWDTLLALLTKSPVCQQQFRKSGGVRLLMPLLASDDQRQGSLSVIACLIIEDVNQVYREETEALLQALRTNRVVSPAGEEELALTSGAKVDIWWSFVRMLGSNPAVKDAFCESGGFKLAVSLLRRTVMQALSVFVCSDEHDRAESAASKDRDVHSFDIQAQNDIGGSPKMGSTKGDGRGIGPDDQLHLLDSLVHVLIAAVKNNSGNRRVLHETITQGDNSTVGEAPRAEPYAAPPAATRDYEGRIASLLFDLALETESGSLALSHASSPSAMRAAAVGTPRSRWRSAYGHLTMAVPEGGAPLAPGSRFESLATGFLTNSASIDRGSVQTGVAPHGSVSLHFHTHGAAYSEAGWGLCKEGNIHNPAAIQLLLQCIGYFSSMLQIKVLSRLYRLAEMGPRYQESLTSVGCVGLLLEALGRVMDDPMSADFVGLAIQSIEVLGAYRFTTAELQALFHCMHQQHDKDRTRRQQLVDMVLRIAQTECLPKKSMSMSGFVTFNVMSVANSNGCVRTSLQDRTWPPAAGYSLSFWVRFQDLKKRRDGLQVVDEGGDSTPKARSAQVVGGAADHQSGGFSFTSATAGDGSTPGPAVEKGWKRPSGVTNLATGGESGNLWKVKAAQAVQHPQQNSFQGVVQHVGDLHHRLQLFAVGSGDERGSYWVDLSIDEHGILTLSTGSNSKLQCDGLSLTNNTWYHIAIVHNKPNAFANLFQSWSMAHIYVDGCLLQAGKLAWAASQPGKLQQVIFGAPPTQPATCAVSWCLGPCQLFEEALDASSIFLIHALGRGYRGLFQDADLGRLLSYDACVKNSLRPAMENWDDRSSLASTPNSTSSGGGGAGGGAATGYGLLARKSALVWDKEKDAVGLGQLAMKKMILAFDATHEQSYMTGAARRVLNLVDSLSSAASTTGGLPRLGFLHGDVQLCRPCSFADGIRKVGGVPLVLAMLEAADTRQMFHSVLLLLASILQNNPKNMNSMTECNGYRLLAILMRGRMNLIGIHELGILFQIAALEAFMPAAASSSFHGRVSSTGGWSGLGTMSLSSSVAVESECELQEGMLVTLDDRSSGHQLGAASYCDDDDMNLMDATTTTTTGRTYRMGAAAAAALTRPSEAGFQSSSMILTNMEMVEHVLMDWTVWVTTAVSLQLAVVAFFERLIGVNQYRRHNIDVLRQHDFVWKMFCVLSRGDIEIVVMEKVIALIGLFIEDGFQGPELDMAADFLVTTFRPTSDSVNPTIDHRHIREGQGMNVILRNMVIEMLIDIQLKINDDETMENWQHQITSLVITYLLDEDLHPTSMRLVVIMTGMFLYSKSSFSLRFPYGAYALCLAAYFDEPEIYYLLFRIMYRRPILPRQPEIRLADFFALVSECQNEEPAFPDLIDWVIAMLKAAFEFVDPIRLLNAAVNLDPEFSSSVASHLRDKSRSDQASFSGSNGVPWSPAREDDPNDSGIPGFQLENPVYLQVLSSGVSVDILMAGVLHFIVEMAKRSSTFAAICRRKDFLESCTELFFTCAGAYHTGLLEQGARDTETSNTATDVKREGAEKSTISDLDAIQATVHTATNGDGSFKVVPLSPLERSSDSLCDNPAEIAKTPEVQSPRTSSSECGEVRLPPPSPAGTLLKASKLTAWLGAAASSDSKSRERETASGSGRTYSLLCTTDGAPSNAFAGKAEPEVSKSATRLSALTCSILHQMQLQSESGAGGVAALGAQLTVDFLAEVLADSVLNVTKGIGEVEIVLDSIPLDVDLQVGMCMNGLVLEKLMASIERRLQRRGESAPGSSPVRLDKSKCATGNIDALSRILVDRVYLGAFLSQEPLEKVLNFLMYILQLANVDGRVEDSVASGARLLLPRGRARQVEPYVQSVLKSANRMVIHSCLPTSNVSAPPGAADEDAWKGLGALVAAAAAAAAAAAGGGGSKGGQGGVELGLGNSNSSSSCSIEGRSLPVSRVQLDCHVAMHTLLANRALIFCPSNVDVDFVCCLITVSISLMREAEESLQNLGVDVMRVLLMQREAMMDDLLCMKGKGNEVVLDILKGGMCIMLTNDIEDFFDWFRCADAEIRRAMNHKVTPTWTECIDNAAKFVVTKMKTIEVRRKKEMMLRRRDTEKKIHAHVEAEKKCRDSVEHVSRAPLVARMNAARQDHLAWVLHTVREWQGCISHIAHDCPEICPVALDDTATTSTWQLSAREGPYRMRKRFERCKLKTFEPPPPCLRVESEMKHNEDADGKPTKAAATVSTAPATPAAAHHPTADPPAADPLVADSAAADPPTTDFAAANPAAATADPARVDLAMADPGSADPAAANPAAGVICSGSQAQEVQQPRESNHDEAVEDADRHGAASGDSSQQRHEEDSTNRDAEGVESSCQGITVAGGESSSFHHSGEQSLRGMTKSKKGSQMYIGDDNGSQRRGLGGGGVVGGGGRGSLAGNLTESLPCQSAASSIVDQFLLDDIFSSEAFSGVRGQREASGINDDGEHLIRPYLEPEDKVKSKHNCDRIMGLEKEDGIFVIGEMCVYFICNYYIDSDLKICEKTKSGGPSVLDQAMGLSGETLFMDSHWSPVAPSVPSASSVPVADAEVGPCVRHADETVGAGGQRGGGGPEADVSCSGRRMSDPEYSFHLLRCFPDNARVHKWRVNQLHEVLKRRYQFRPVAVELFSTEGYNELFIFHLHERDEVYRSLLARNGNAPRSSVGDATVSGASTPESKVDAVGLFKQKAKSMTKKWQAGEVSNFQYLMHLNTLAGRSYNDLTQYPVFPWVLADYDSQELDFSNPETFRRFDKPMGAQNPEREMQFKRRYESWEDPLVPKFHYGSHYSSSGIVLYYLIRLPPFSTQNRQLQGGRFDVADRIFSCVKETWSSASGGHTADVKELIPEFFYLPEFLENRGRLELGNKQDGEKVAEVALPPWANGSAREFVRKHREALECPYVSEHLNEWIDLIFGYQQQGKASVDATNVFYYLTYEGAVAVDSIQDPREKARVLDQINHFGQTPRQLFEKPHPKRRVPQPPLHPLNCLHDHDIVVPQEVRKLSSRVGDIVQTSSGKLCVAGANRVLKPPAYNKVFAWGFPDGSLRVMLYEGEKLLSTHEAMHDDGRVMCGAVGKSGKVLVTGGEDGVVGVWNWTKVGSRTQRRMVLKRALCSHTRAVRSIAVCQSYGIIVSGSEDKTCTIWDLNTLEYVCRLPRFDAPVTAVHVNEMTGDIATGAGTTLSVWNVNGECLATRSTSSDTSDQIVCVTTPQALEWLEMECFVTGHSNGLVKIWCMEHRSRVQRARGSRASAATNAAEDAHSSKPSERSSPAPAAEDINRIAHPPPKMASSAIGEEQSSQQPEYLLTLRKVLPWHHKTVTALYISTDLKQLFSGDRDGRVACWAIAVEEAAPDQLSQDA